MKLSSWTGFLSASLGVVGLTVLASATSAQAASLTFNQSDLKLNSGSTAVNFDVKLDDLGDGKVQVKVDVANGYFADLRGLFFNISDDSILSSLSVDKSLYPDITTFAQGGVSWVGSNNNNVNGGNEGGKKGGKSESAFDFGVEIGDEGIGRGKLDIRSTTFVIEDASKKLNVSYFSQQAFGIRMMSVGTSATNREGSSKLLSPSLPPVAVVTTDPPREEKPVEVPEPSATVALAIATVAAVKFAKRNKVSVAAKEVA
jgi:hypothetical protein